MNKILILNVDDNLNARYARTRLLMNAGLRVEEAESGADLHLAAPFEPMDLVSNVRALLRTH